MLKKIDKNLFSAILYIALGLLFIIFRGKTVEWAMTIAGIVFLVSGALDVIKKNYTSGGISLIIGAAIILLGWLLTDIVLKVLGILVAVKGIISLLESFKSKKINVVEIVYTALTVIAGILLVFATGEIINTIILIAGIIFVIDGVLGLLPLLKK